MTAVTTSPPVGRRVRSRPGALLAVVLTGQFMAIMDVSIVNVAAPTIRADLGASGAALQLIVSGYTIAYAVLLISGARLGGRFGPGRVFQLGLALFTAASLACGLAGSAATLVAFRLLQGAGAALMVPQVLSTIQLNFAGASRARALSVYSAVLAGGVVAGQVLGGALVAADLLGAQWRPVFLVNVPIGAVLLVAGRRALPAGRGPAGRGADVAGLVTLAVAVSLLVVPLVLGREQGWPAWCRWSLAGSVVAVALFAAVERRAAHPLVPGRLLRAPGLVPAALGVFVAMVTWGGFLFAIALHLQGALGYGALAAGLTFVPGGGGFALLSLTWRRLPGRAHRPLILAGFALAAAGYLGVGYAFAWSATAAGVALLALAGIGLGAAYSPLFTVALAGVAPADAPDASGVMAMMLQLGQVVGVATFGTLYLAMAPSPDAIGVTCAWLAALALAGAGCAAPLLRRRPAAAA
ncbi:MFS transporter [Sphaerisporangium rufum]|uniref:MFS transporter n=1 Tax=Sphaerisporangium rufum TaxID=1381558 RepID=A0A919R7H7_9ACTN|nr:MFS transporter [Sphaerisporangium rufum]GII81092.1 MFS transporter [Sphaerisporangium rufum]